MSPWPVSGYRPDSRSRWLQPAALRSSASNSSNSARSAGLSLSARAAISFLRAAAFAALAISGLREAKNSCSWSLTRSQGGLPMTQEKPPAQPVAGSMSVAPLPTRKMWGNSTCQWKKRYWRVRSDDQVLGCG